LVDAANLPLPDDEDDLHLIFDPGRYNSNHKPLRLQEYRLPHERLKQLAQSISQVRARFLAEASQFQLEAVDGDGDQPRQRTRKGTTLSVRSRDEFGMSQREYSDMERKEKYLSGKMKKRHLKALDAEERSKIAEEHLVDNVQMLDVASKHHISSGLVGRICKDYRNGANQIKQRQRKE